MDWSCGVHSKVIDSHKEVLPVAMSDRDMLENEWAGL